jgi:hypothetical protein
VALTAADNRGSIGVERSDGRGVPFERRDHPGVEDVDVLAKRSAGRLRQPAGEQHGEKGA